jgi:hypothetical protein
MAVQMLPRPGVPKRLGIRLQREVREGVLRSSRSKEARALGILFGQGPRLLEGFGLPHKLDPRARLTQAGVVDLAGGFQASEQGAFLGRSHSASGPRTQTTACVCVCWKLDELAQPWASPSLDEELLFY